MEMTELVFWRVSAIRCLVYKRSGTKIHNIKRDEVDGPITKATEIAATRL